ncbi:nuclear transport factor 2 family protein [Spirillospora sp. CA-255316]
MTSQEVFQRYIIATMSRDAGQVAALFAEDGVLEAPLMPEGAGFPRRMEGREEIRAGLADYYRRPPACPELKVDFEKTRYALHETSDAFIAEIDTVFEDGSAVSLVQIFRVRDGEIALMRDYFAPDVLG